MREAYHIPSTLEEAARLLARYGGAARVVGGGTDFFVDEGHQDVSALVDVTRLEGLSDVSYHPPFVMIGCGATHSRIVASPLIQQRGTALAEACGQIGGPQVRNVATLAGNIAHALPAADGTLALLALGGEVMVAWAEGDALRTEWRALAQMFLGPGRSAMDSTRHIIAAMRFLPTGEREASAFARVMRPQGVALPIMGLAVRLRLGEDLATIESATVTAGPAGPVPFCARQCTQVLQGRPLNERVIAEAGEALLAEAQLRDSPHRATRAYRAQVLPVLLRRALHAAYRRAQAAQHQYA
ncbi:MAG: FAD binding domain-containing protein [Thermoflexales bacterium]